VLPNSPEYHELLSYQGRKRWRVIPDNAVGRDYLREMVSHSYGSLNIQMLPQKDSQGRKIKPRAERFSALDFIKFREERKKGRFSTRGRGGYPGTKNQQSSLKRSSDSRPDSRSLFLEIFEAWSATSPFFLRGDVNQDGQVDILDANGLLRFFYDKEYEPPCLESADVNNDGRVQFDDALQLISYVTHGLSPPALPFPACGRDPDELGSGKDIGCLSHEAYPKETEDEDQKETP